MQNLHLPLQMTGKEAAHRLSGSGVPRPVDVFVVQPGMTSTDLFRKMVGAAML